MGQIPIAAAEIIMCAIETLMNAKLQSCYLRLGFLRSLLLHLSSCHGDRGKRDWARDDAARAVDAVQRVAEHPGRIEAMGRLGEAAALLGKSGLAR